MQDFNHEATGPVDMVHVTDHNKFDEERKHSPINVDPGEYQFKPMNQAKNDQNEIYETAEQFEQLIKEREDDPFVPGGSTSNRNLDAQ